MIAPLQLSATDSTLETAVWAVLAAGLLVTGLAITALAFRGYRQYRSRPMLFIAVGFGLLMANQLLINPVAILFSVGEFAARTATQATQLLGSLSILYAVYIKRPDDP